MISRCHNKSIVWICTALVSTLCAYPESAAAQWEHFVGSVIGGAIGGALGAHRAPAPRGYSKRRGARSAPQNHQPSRAASGSADETGSREGSSRPNDRNDRIRATLAPATKIQTAVLKTLVPSAVLGAVGSTDDFNRLGEVTSKERERDYTAHIEDLIRQFKQQVRQQKAIGEGDITAYAIEQAIDSAYKDAQLQRFETFIGENWSVERLRVMILDRVNAEVDALFLGTNRGQVSMDDLRRMIDKAARIVYLRLFETSELLAANKSSTNFVQRLYQAHGDLMQGDVREGAERMLMKASAVVSAHFDGLIRRDENSYALHYRQQRIVFDCLTENVEGITSSGDGIATIDEIKQRIGDVQTEQCMAWVSNQFLGPDGKLKAQVPMPLRVVWSADGARDDPSMYGRPIGPQ